MSEKNEVVEAVRERVRMADQWAKSTGYPPADYFDTIMDLRRMLRAYDDLAGSPTPPAEAKQEAKPCCRHPKDAHTKGGCVGDFVHCECRTTNAGWPTPKPADKENWKWPGNQTGDQENDR